MISEHLDQCEKTFLQTNEEHKLARKMPKPSKVFLQAVQTHDSSLVMSSNEESLEIFEKLYVIPCKCCSKEISVVSY